MFVQWYQWSPAGFNSWSKVGRGDLGQRASHVAEHWLMLLGNVPATSSLTCRPQSAFLTCRTGLVCVLGKLVGLLSHRIKSFRDRHVLRRFSLPPSPWECLASSWPSSSWLNRRWWWSRYAALRDRKRANHLWMETKWMSRYLKIINIYYRHIHIGLGALSMMVVALIM